MILQVITAECITFYATFLAIRKDRIQTAPVACLRLSQLPGGSGIRDEGHSLRVGETGSFVPKFH